MSSYKTLDALVAETAGGSIILIRADLNVPLDERGAVRDATRLERLLPSLEKLSQSGFRIGALSHFGRPKGQRVAEMSLAPIAVALGDLLGQKVTFAEDCIGDAAQEALAALPEGGICVLENTRFHAGEEADDADFAAALAAPADAYVNDAFSAAHRAHASTHGITKYVPTYCGLAMRHSVGTSLCEDSMLETARAIMAEAETQGCTILLPRDAVVASQFAAGQSGETVAAHAVPDDKMILDAGPDAVGDICAAFDKAATIIWNGPLGAFEIEPFDAATNHAAQYAAALTRKGQLTSIAGGGDTVAALNHAGAGKDFTYVSTAGGAFLEWLEGKTLPGVAALSQN
ncbi:MAG: phosphoglycerate kinase [Alphaproteobacteria bacterium]|nr:phosphoglycerate kinase [Alphaproteobacteria bacterium]